MGFFYSSKTYAINCRRIKRDLFQRLWMNGKRHMTEVADELKENFTFIHNLLYRSHFIYPQPPE
jgi:hypothetical protein